MPLTANERRALALLDKAGLNGMTESLLNARGFGGAFVDGLADRGLATLTREQARAGRQVVEVSKVRITEAGRAALAAEG